MIGVIDIIGNVHIVGIIIVLKSDMERFDTNKAWLPTSSDSAKSSSELVLNPG